MEAASGEGVMGRAVRPVLAKGRLSRHNLRPHSPSVMSDRLSHKGIIDSRKTLPGDLFVAIVGEKAGRRAIHASWQRYV